MYEWKTWLMRNMKTLQGGDRIFVLARELPHPAYCEGFKKVDGWPDGQRCDWALRLDDGSRIHVQCYLDQNGVEKYRIHRDKWDPSLGLESWLMHALFETPAGPAIGILASVLVVALVANTATE